MHQSWARVAALCIGLLCTTLGYAATPAKGDASPPAAGQFDASLSPMRARVERFATDQSALERCYRLTLSDNRRQRLEKFYHQQMDALTAVDFDGLDQSGRIDYLLLRNKIDFESRQLEIGRAHV